MNAQESRIANSARRGVAAMRNADHRMGEAARSTVEVIGGTLKVVVLGSAAVAGLAYMVKLLDEPVKEIVADAASVIPGLPDSSVELQTPIRVGGASTATSEGLWNCADSGEVRSSAVVTDYLGRMVISEYGLGDHNDAATYDLAIDLLQTSAFQELNPHIIDINQPPMGEAINFPVCELK